MSRPDSIANLQMVDPHAASDFSSLIKRVEGCHLRAAKSMAESVIAMFEAGHELLKAKEETKYGDWGSAFENALLASEAVVTFRTCQRYMKVARVLSDCAGSPAVKYLADRKTTRASFLAFLNENKLTSMSSVLATSKSARGRTGAAKSSPLNRRSKILNHGPEHDKTNGIASISASNNAGLRNEASLLTASGRSDSQVYSEEDNFLTPDSIIECVVDFLGAIDMDPCGAADRPEHVPATRVVQHADDCLSDDVPWSGRIFLHPPQSNPMPFVRRATMAAISTDTDYVILFLPAITDAEYMADLHPFPKAFLRDRPTFTTARGELVRPTNPYMLVLVSFEVKRHTEKFNLSFGHIADIYVPFWF